MERRIYQRFLCGCVILYSHALYAQPSMVSLSEAELSKVQGQALMNLSYLAPSDSGNYESGSNVSGSVKMTP